MPANTIGFKGLKVPSGGIGALVRWNVSPKKAVRAGWASSVSECLRALNERARLYLPSFGSFMPQTNHPTMPLRKTRESGSGWFAILSSPGDRMPISTTV